MAETPPATPPATPPVTDPPATPPVTDPPATPPVTPPVTGGWMDGLDGNVREGLTAKNYATVNDLGKAYLELEPLIAAKGIIPPKDGASPEDIEKFHLALGRPATVKDYDLGDFKPPEGLPWNEAVQGTMLQAMFDEGLTSGAVQRIIGKYAEGQHGAYTEFLGDQETDAAADLEALRKGWGTSSDKNMDLAQRAAKAFASPDAIDQVENVFGYAATMKMFAAIGQKLGEDGLVIPDSGGDFVGTPEAAQAELNKIMGEATTDEKHAYNNRKHPEHEAITERVMQLHAIINPGEVAPS